MALKESDFIKQRLKFWQSIDPTKNKNVGYAEDTFQSLQDDLGYAQSHYRKKSIVNTLSQLFANVYLYLTTQRNEISIKTFYLKTVPEHLYHIQRYVKYSFVITMIGVLFGYFAYLQNEDVALDILGEQYVEQTKENIANGDPLAIYKSENEMNMFVFIALNNLKVALILFVFGSLLSFGSLLILLLNSIMIGVFSAMLIENGQGKAFFLTVFQHGTIEILAMIIEGACGLAIGLAIFNPGIYSKKNTLILNAKSAGIVMLGLFPLIVFAAFLESFLTRHTHLPDALRITIIFLSLIFMVLYMFVYPLQKFKHYKPKLNPIFNDSKLSANEAHLKSNINKMVLLNALKKVIKHRKLIFISWILLLGTYAAAVHFDLVSEFGKAQLQKDQISNNDSGNFLIPLLNTLFGSFNFYFSIFMSTKFSVLMSIPIFLIFNLFIWKLLNDKHLANRLLVSLTITIIAAISGEFATYTLVLSLPFLLFFTIKQSHLNTVNEIFIATIPFYISSIILLLCVALAHIASKLLIIILISLMNNVYANKSTMETTINTHMSHGLTLLFLTLTIFILIESYKQLCAFLKEKHSGTILQSRIEAITAKESAYGLEVEK